MVADKFFDLALEMAKQLLTLSSGLLALSLVLLKDVATSRLSRTARVLLFLFWFIQVLSICAGILHIGALAGAATGNSPVAGLYPRGAAFTAKLQIYLFGGGLLPMLGFVGSVLDLGLGAGIRNAWSRMRNRLPGPMRAPPGADAEASETFQVSADPPESETLQVPAAPAESETLEPLANEDPKNEDPVDAETLEQAPRGAHPDSMISPKRIEEPPAGATSQSLEDATGDSAVADEEGRTRGAL